MANKVNLYHSVSLRVMDTLGSFSRTIFKEHITLTSQLIDTLQKSLFIWGKWGFSGYALIVFLF